MNNDHPLAYQDEAFLDSTDARPIRILAEYLDPLRRFKLHNIQDTVVFFGSARVLSRTTAQRNLTRIQKTNGRAQDDYKAALKRSRKALEWSRYYEDARQLANRLTTWSMSLEAQRHRFVVCSGGGIVRAVAEIVLVSTSTITPSGGRWQAFSGGSARS